MPLLQPVYTGFWFPYVSSHLENRKGVHDISIREWDKDKDPGIWWRLDISNAVFRPLQTYKMGPPR